MATLETDRNSKEKT